MTIVDADKFSNVERPSGVANVFTADLTQRQWAGAVRRGAGSGLKVQLATPATEVRLTDGGVSVTYVSEQGHYDACVIACRPSAGDVDQHR